ncbi:hypothetical protein TELCIR_10684 [Teladorsagia circumcincta]|uniref:SCP domain-containing protein n=1 Tax=Teladorsagia circumcincta TaxID=45464 RepID=A0A2G9UBF0_TELCI|nr:hypothetical protein TELCIR_10684 [Teladorsagia circumcincta]
MFVPKSTFGKIGPKQKLEKATNFEIIDPLVKLANKSRLAQGLVPNGLTGKKLPQGMNIYELTYSTTLEHDAQVYANTCPSSGSDETSRNEQGENFATIPSSEANSYLVAIFRVCCFLPPFVIAFVLHIQ